MPVYKDKERGTYFYQYTKTIGGKKIQKRLVGSKPRTQQLLQRLKAKMN